MTSTLDSPRALSLIVDREDERYELTELVERGKPALALLTGRRRVGKTYLLTHTWPSAELFLFTAAHTTSALNRQQLLRDLADWSGMTVNAGDYPTWRTVFRLMMDIAEQRAEGEPSRRSVMVLDEFQYMADGDSGLAEVASELNAVWERKRSRVAITPVPLLVVLSGSAVTTMEALAAGGAPLYGRFAWQHTLKPFTYWHAANLTPFTSPRDLAFAYGIFGGTPRYLSALRPAHTLARNAAELLLSPRGEVRHLVESALDQEEGLRDPGKYRAILRAVADGCTERNAIAQRTGLSNDQALREKLATLVELDYLEQRQNIDARPNDPIRYRIADAAFRFYYRFVAPNASMLDRYPIVHTWKTNVAPHLNAYMGLEFERIAVQAYDRHALALGLPAVKKWGRWEGADRARKSLEIDIVAPLADGRTMTGSVKWNRAPVEIRVHYAHMDMLRRAADAGRAWAQDALVSNAPILYVASNGFVDDFRREAEAGGRPVICWTLEDIYAE